MINSFNDKSGMIFGQFKHMFPHYYEATVHYGPWGGDSIRIELKAGITLIFEYIDRENWCLKTTTNDLMHLQTK